MRKAKMSKINARNRIVNTVRKLYLEKRQEIEKLKQGRNGLKRPDFIWHYILQSFATWGRASGWDGLIGNKNNYQRITYNALNRLSPEECKNHIQDVFRDSNIRWPNKKAIYIFNCVARVRELGGLKATKDKLLATPGRGAKINFLRSFPGIGPKYARNIMMDVYHEDFR